MHVVNEKKITAHYQPHELHIFFKEHLHMDGPPNFQRFYPCDRVSDLQRTTILGFQRSSSTHINFGTKLKKKWGSPSRFLGARH